jgi:coproporphyrinogen III oxidase
MELVSFIKEMKARSKQGLLAVAADGEAVTQIHRFSIGQAEITTVVSRAVEKAAITHMTLENVRNPETGETHDATVYQMEIFPKNPHCPMGHFNTEWTTINGENRYHMNLDLFPAVADSADVEGVRQAMDLVADQYGRDPDALREGLGLQYHMPHWDGPLAAQSGFQMKGLAEDELPLFIAAYRTFWDAYLGLLEQRKDTPYTGEEETLKLKRNGRWLEYVTIKDRAVKAAQAIGVPPEAIVALCYPPSAVF